MAVTCTCIGVFTFVFMLFQQVYADRWWTTLSTTTKYHGTCSYRELDYYYFDYVTRYKYCSYKCCGTYIYRYCCYKPYSYVSYYSSSTNIGAWVGIICACIIVFIILSGICHVIRRSRQSNQQDQMVFTGRVSATTQSSNTHSSQTSDANAYRPPSYTEGICNSAYSTAPVTSAAVTPSAPPPSYDEVVSQYTLHHNKDGENVYI